MKEKIKGFIDQSIRVLKLARKPTKDEFLFVSKVTGIGIAIIGTIGFIIMTIHYFLTA